MPRRFLKRIMPDHDTMREHPHLRKFGQRLTEPRLWHLNRRSVSGGVALGLFVGFMPILGQIFIAAALAIWLRVNLPIASMAVWVTNPFTVAPIFFYAYKLGAWVLQIPMQHYAFSLSWEWFSQEFLNIWQPLLLGSVICGIVAALLGILFVRLIWRLVVIRSWIRRPHKNNSRL
ncbi:DUF2062 domain-containing protein [uncultured Methylophaga sp.]|uniref:DUF2062 domain-containing protein n=1 Tax=uncultured Methylophaga sp. TaxID=285271 RepID=UPI002635A5D5|nr:DUF2062 domain-containing protein [uncultured Methylophaga sp.]